MKGERKYLLIQYVSILHLLWAICVLLPKKLLDLEPSVLSQLYLFFPNKYGLAIVLAFSSFLSFLGLAKRETMTIICKVATFAPQQFLMTLATVSAISYIVSEYGCHGSYKIFGLPIVLLAFYHLYSILDIETERNCICGAPKPNKK